MRVLPHNGAQLGQARRQPRLALLSRTGGPLCRLPLCRLPFRRLPFRLARIRRGRLDCSSEDSNVSLSSAPQADLLAQLTSSSRGACTPLRLLPCPNGPHLPCRSPGPLRPRLAQPPCRSLRRPPLPRHQRRTRRGPPPPASRRPQRRPPLQVAQGGLRAVPAVAPARGLAGGARWPAPGGPALCPANSASSAHAVNAGARQARGISKALVGLYWQEEAENG